MIELEDNKDRRYITLTMLRFQKPITDVEMRYQDRKDQTKSKWNTYLLTIYDLYKTVFPYQSALN